jgi:hypothetical protein
MATLILLTTHYEGALFIGFAVGANRSSKSRGEGTNDEILSLDLLIG